MKRYRTETLIDLLGARQAEYVNAKRALDDVKAELLRRGIESGQGNAYSFAAPTTTSMRIDMKAVRSTFTDKVIDGFRKPVSSRQWHIHALVEHRKPVAA